MRTVTIGGRTFGAGQACVIGEVGLAHDGSLGLAHAFVDAIAATGADAVKFQTHIAAAESTAREPWRVHFSKQDASRYDYWKRTEFTAPQWAALKQHADECGLLFLSSPFSSEAVELLAGIGVPAWKVASGEASNTPMLEQMAATGLPVLLSTGLSPLAEIDANVERLASRGAPFAVFQCTSEYPCAPERVGLELVPFFADRYDCASGLSDHSGTIYPSLAATVLGAAFVEVHVTLSRMMHGPDVKASVTLEELGHLTTGVRCIERMQSAAADKDALAAAAAPLRAIFGKSVVARTALPAGTILTAESLALKKPGNGTPAAAMSSLVGRTLARNLSADDPIIEQDLLPPAEGTR